MTRKIISVVLVLVGLVLIGIIIYRFIVSRRPNAGLKVQTNPESVVFVDNVQIGKTPAEKIFLPGEVSLKIVPTSTDSALSTYQTKVQLNPKTYTVVHRDFGPTDAQTAGEIVTLEPQTSKEASVSILSSSPDTASVTIDGQPQGFTQVWIPSISEGDHEILVSAPGFVSRSISAQTVLGHKLTVNVKLAAEFSTSTQTAATSDLMATPSATPKPGAKVSPTPGVSPKKPYVEIKDTPTGFLRVRQKPSTAGVELGQIAPGSQHHLLESQSGWYRIEVDLDATSSGWISSQYATKVE